MQILNLLWGVPYGGIGRCFYAYDRLNHKPDLHLSNACIVTEKVRQKHATILSRTQKDLRARIISISGYHDLSWIKAVKELVKSSRPDILFVHGFNGPIVASACQRIYNINLPFVCSYHGRYHPPTPGKSLLAPVYNHLMERVYRRHAAGVVTVCSYCKDYLLKRGISEDKITVIHNGIPDTPDQTVGLTRQQIGLTKDDFVLGTISRLDPVKGLPHLINAFAGISQKLPHAKLVLVGDGPYTNQLKARCKELGVAHAVLFMGYQSNTDAWLNLFDVFVLPSLHEYHSIGLLEAMRAGLPIVASNVGGNTESVRHEKEALIVPPADPKILATALMRMINEPDLRERLSKATRQRFEIEFTEKIMLEKLADWFHSFEFSK